MESKMFLYKILHDLPDPPEDLIAKVDLFRAPEKMEIGIHNKRYLKNWNGNYYAGVNVRVKNEHFEEWVKENIYSNIVDAGVNYVNLPEGVTHLVSTGAHVDVIRKFTLLYNIRTGGKDIATVFWREKGHQDIRPPGTQVEDLSKLEEITRAVFPARKWCILYTQVLHSVENLSEPRVAFQVSLNEVPAAWGITDVVMKDFTVDYNSLYKRQEETGYAYISQPD